VAPPHTAPAQISTLSRHDAHPISELGTQLRVLRADADRAGVGMALPHHDAAHGDQRRRADTVFLGTQHGCDHHVATGLDAAVGRSEERRVGKGWRSWLWAWRGLRI